MAKQKNHKVVEDERKREAQRILNRVEREVEQVGASTMARTANKVRDHFMGEEKSRNDPAEIWGKRIGRSLAVIVFIGLAISLYVNYIAPQ